jgi:hypothetical protein
MPRLAALPPVLWNSPRQAASARPGSSDLTLGVELGRRPQPV